MERLHWKFVGASVGLLAFTISPASKQSASDVYKEEDDFGWTTLYVALGVANLPFAANTFFTFGQVLQTNLSSGVSPEPSQLQI
jgi:hypothetical protein